MFERNIGRDKAQAEQKRTEKKPPAIGPSPAQRDKDKASSFEQFQERGYDSGFVYHEE